MLTRIDAARLLGNARPRTGSRARADCGLCLTPVAHAPLAQAHTMAHTDTLYLLYLVCCGSSSPSYSGVPGSRVIVSGERRPSEPFAQKGSKRWTGQSSVHVGRQARSTERGAERVSTATCLLQSFEPLRAYVVEAGCHWLEEALDTRHAALLGREPGAEAGGHWSVDEAGAQADDLEVGV